MVDPVSGRWRSGRTLTGASVLALALAACAVGPDFKRPRAPAAADFGSAAVSGTTTAGEGPGGSAQQFVTDLDLPGQWWTLFQSPKLTRLVQDALHNNPGIDAARASLRQAHELYLAQRGAFLPQIQGSASASRARNADQTLANPTVAPSAIYNLYTAQLTLSYSPDVFGLNRRSVESARAQSESMRYQLMATYVTLSSNVVVTAVQEASLREQIAATERLLEIQRQITDRVRQQVAVGTASELDLLTQQAAQQQTEATLPPLHKELGQTRDALTALLGRLPSQEPAETFTLADLTLPTQLPVSLPSRLIDQRPDVRQAEENLHAASAQAGVALASMLPQFDITGNLGSSALKLGSLFGPYTGFWSLGASLTQTLFDGGALLHRKRAADAALDEAAAQYRAAVILACQNVADSLRALQADAEALKASGAAAAAAARSLELARGQFKLGTIAFVVLLNAESTYLQTQQTAIQARAGRFADTAGLFQALGGGWWNLQEARIP